MGALGDQTRALQTLEEASAIFSPVREEYPDNAEYLLNAAAIQLVRRDIHFRKHDLNAARDTLIHATTLLCDAAEQAPGQLNFRGHLCDQLRDLSQMPMDDKTTAKLLPLAETIARHLDSKPESHEFLALILARCIPEIGTDDRHEVLRHRDRCSSLAVDLLLKGSRLGYLRVQSVKRDERFANLRDYPPFLRMAEPEPGSDLSPSRFTYHYAHDDPGPRQWVHSGNNWTETQPSGRQNIYQTSRRIRLGGISGTELIPVPETSLRIFIPDKTENVPPKMLFHMGNEDWGFIGNMENVE